MGKEDTTQEGRMWAAISYGSVFIGFPLGVIALVQRNDAFALHHAKHAVAVQLAFIAGFFLSFAVGMIFAFCTFGLSNLLLLPFLFLLMLANMGINIHGLILAINGDWGEPIGSFGLGDKVFSNLELITDDGAGASSDTPDAE